MIPNEPVQMAPRTKSSVQSQMRKQQDDVSTSSVKSVPTAPAVLKETRLMKRLQSDAPIEVSEDTGDEPPSIEPEVQVKEEPMSEGEEEEELFKRTAKLKASFCIQRYLEQDSGDSADEEPDQGSDDAWEEPEMPFSPMEAEPPLQVSGSNKKQPDAEKLKLEKDMLATFPEELKKRVTKLLQANNPSLQNPSLQTVFESVSLKMAEEIASRVYGDWKLSDAPSFDSKVKELHKQMLSTMESFPNMKTFQPVLPPGAKPMLASRPQMANFRQIAPRPQVVPGATSQSLSVSSAPATHPVPSSQLLIQRPVVPSVAVVNPRSLIAPQGQIMVAPGPHMFAQGQRFVAGQPQQVLIRQPPPGFAMAQSQALVQSTATMVMAGPNLVMAAPGMPTVNRFTQAAFAQINTVRNNAVRNDLRENFISAANTNISVAMPTPQTVVAASQSFMRPPGQPPQVIQRPPLQPIGLKDQLNQLDHQRSPPKSLPVPTVTSTPKVSTNSVSTVSSTPVTSTTSTPITSATVATDEECQITKAVGIMPAINLPNGKKLKLVPEGNVPENVRNYVRDNYEEILKRLSMDKDKTNLRNQRLLVHADGTLEMSATQRKPPPPNNTSDTPIILDMDDEDETPTTTATATTTTSLQPSASTTTQASTTIAQPTNSSLPQAPPPQAPPPNAQFAPHPNVMNPLDPNAQIRHTSFMFNPFQAARARMIDPRTGAVRAPHMISPQQMAQQQLRQQQMPPVQMSQAQPNIPNMPQGPPQGPTIQHVQGTPIQHVMQPVYGNQFRPVASQGQLNAQFPGARIVQRPLNFRNPQHAAPNMRHPMQAVPPNAPHPPPVANIPASSRLANPQSPWVAGTPAAIANGMSMPATGSLNSSVRNTVPNMSTPPSTKLPQAAPSVSIDIVSDDDSNPAPANALKNTPPTESSAEELQTEHSTVTKKGDAPLIDRNKADALAQTIKKNQQRMNSNNVEMTSTSENVPDVKSGNGASEDVSPGSSLDEPMLNNTDSVESDVSKGISDDSTNVVKKAGLNLFGLLGGTARKRISAKFNNALSSKLFKDKLRDVRRFKTSVHCYKCKKSFKFRSQMLNHFILFHNFRNSSRNVSNMLSEPSTSQNCTKCNNSFNSSTQLSNHMWFVHKVKRFQCQACKKRFISKRLAANHFKATHWLLRNKELCTQCSNNPRTQPSSSETKRGMARSSCSGVHRTSLLNRCLCRKCGGSLRAREGEFSCKYCSKLFFDKDAMTKHVRLHSKIMRTAKRKRRQRQQACLECGKLFHTHKSLNKHKKDVHAVL